ncbi:hypothetical protein [Rugamonas sp.]|uniref:hypothetical protein n=1 Tax=Rugamonas sp. TaxID=1926287 RepID=UPI0025E79319|nr:hypothetical protein [Rugamonas sp.]
MSKFFEYFKENMDGLGLPCPESLFATQALAVQTVKTLIEYVEKYGPRTLVRDLVGAGTRLEKLGLYATGGVAFYTGAVIGSLAVATGRTLAGGTSIAEVLSIARQSHINTPWLPAMLQRYPGFVNPQIGTRKMYRYAARPHR